mmetsp:Transcript_44937/g.103939  ORF Transcript_44937/g.103939 Transcript_44937/m.103939 type:complete len:853 (-) Transcript_44937:87-2645(-)
MFPFISSKHGHQHDAYKGVPSSGPSPVVGLAGPKPASPSFWRSTMTSSTPQSLIAVLVGQRALKSLVARSQAEASNLARADVSDSVAGDTRRRRWSVLPHGLKLMQGFDKSRRRKLGIRVLSLVGVLLFSAKAVAASTASTAPSGPLAQVVAFLSSSLAPLSELLKAGPQRDVLGLLGATMLFVPMMKILRTSSILGFLAMGVVLGPSGLNCISGLHEAHFFAEFGIIFFLFEMGLELSVEKVLSMKYDVFGIGSFQFFGTGLIIACLAHFFAPSLPVTSLVVLGGGLALSSSAFVLQLVRDKGQLATRYGRASFGVLLLQDLAVVPLLVVVPLLANSSGGSTALMRALGLAAARAGMALGLISVLGRVVMARVFHFAIWAQSSEAFLAVTMGTVLICSGVTEGLGLSTTLGAFLAGVLLSETPYRHQIEADIAPFRGMLLGLFFTTVGFSIDLNLLATQWYTIFPLIIGLLLLKAGVVAGTCAIFKVAKPSAIQTSLLLAPGGEFAFVIFKLADELHLLPPKMSSMLVTATALSMAITPVVARLGEGLATELRGRLQAREGTDAEAQDLLARAESAGGFVAVCGYGRIGKVICQILDAEGKVNYIVLEKNPEKAIAARQAGLPVFLADCTRRDVLESFSISKAKLVVLAMGERNPTDKCARALRSICPNVKMLVRAQDSSQQAYLENVLGVQAVVPALPPDSVLLSLPFGGEVMKRLGFNDARVYAMMEEQRRKIYQEGGFKEFSVTRAALENTFKLFDPNGDGYIHTAELRTIMIKLRERNLDDNDFEQLLERLESCRAQHNFDDELTLLDLVQLFSAARLLSQSDEKRVEGEVSDVSEALRTQRAASSP